MADILTLTKEQLLERKALLEKKQQLLSMQKQSNQGDISTPQTFKQNDLTQRIAQRPDIYSEAVGMIPELSKQVVPPPFNTNPVIPNFILKSLGGVQQRGEAMLANPILEMNRFTPDLPLRMMRGIKQGFTGEKLGEIGDTARQAGMPESIASTYGLAMTGGLTNKLFSLSQKAASLDKINTTYGKDMGRNIIRQTTQLPMPLVERGMKRGWSNILSKSNAKDVDLPTRISKQVIDALDDITTAEHDAFGKVANRVKTGNVKAIDVNQVVEETLKSGGYLDDAYKPTLKTRGPVVEKVLNFVNNAKRGKIKPDDKISINIVQALKDKLKSYVPPKNWIGKNRSLTTDQRIAKDLSNKLDDLVAYNSFGVEDTEYLQANTRYSNFKNFEAAILDRFSEVVGQEVIPTAKKIVGLSKTHPTVMKEEIAKLGYIDDFLKSKGHSRISDELLDWLTTQEMMIQPEGGIFKRFTQGPVEYATRQLLKTGATGPMGKGIEATGRTIQPFRNYVNQRTMLPTMGLRGGTRGLNQE